MISTTVPDAGDGTSVSTLSVEISTIVSSASMRSPSCLAQRLIVPSETLTPIWGMTTSTRLPTAMCSAPSQLRESVRREALDRLHDIVDLRDERLLERRRERHRRVRRGHAQHRCVEQLEALLGDRG